MNNQEKMVEQEGRLQTSPNDFVLKLVSSLKPRTKDILVKRFGLNGDRKRTLEEIGQGHNITRERVRQIESAALKDLRKGNKIMSLQPCESLLESIIHEHGRVMEHDNLVNTFTNRISPVESHENVVEFILNLSDKFNHFDELDHLRRAWGVKDGSLDIPQKVIEVLESVLQTKEKPVKEQEAVKVVLKHELADQHDLSDEKIVKSYLTLSKKILRNPFGEWGFASWNEITPKGVKDKAYLVLKKNNKPLHFTAITDEINKVKFSGKKAIPQTVHNELIKDERFVLVGRGIYGLAEWGYSPGTVAEVVEKILAKSSNPLSKEEIVDGVLKQRVVKRNTVVLTLQDKSRFKRVQDKLYTLAK